MPLVRRLMPLALALTCGILPHLAFADAPPLIPRELLFGNPERASPQLSPDGKRIAWLAPDANHVQQVWVKTIGKDDDKAVTADKKRPVRIYAFAENNTTLLYLQDADGDENFHVFGVDLPSGNVRDYTPWQGVRAGLEALDPKFPNTVLIAANARDRKLMDVWRLDLATGALTLDTQNPGDVAGWAADAKLVVRGAQVVTPDGGTELRVRDHAKAPWRSWLKVGREENLDLIDFSLDGRSVFLSSSIGADTARVVERDLKTGKEKVLASSADADADGEFVHPTKHVVQAVAFNPARRSWTVLDAQVKPDFAAIEKLDGGDFAIINRDLADQNWLVAFT